jgi:hypothetical protein
MPPRNDLVTAPPRGASAAAADDSFKTCYSLVLYRMIEDDHVRKERRE